MGRHHNDYTSCFFFLFSTRHGRREPRSTNPVPTTATDASSPWATSLFSLSLSLLRLCGIQSKTTTIEKFSSLPIKFDRLKPTKLLLPLCVCPSTAQQPVTSLAVSYTHNGMSWLAGWLGWLLDFYAYTDGWIGRPTLEMSLLQCPMRCLVE